MTLHVHRAERADGLVGALRELLGAPLGDPFAPEVISVPTRGMERWLAQRLSSSLGAGPGRADGICANVVFPSPARLVGDAIAAASGVAPDEDPWRPERAVWPLLTVIDRSLGEPWAAQLTAHLGGDADSPDPVRRARRLGVARHVAGLFDRYALHRPEMLLAWADGEEAGWQAELWRRLREQIAVPGPAERLDPACARLAADPGLVDLPPRLSLFGLTRLPIGVVRILRALAVQRDVHLCLLHPSPALWQTIAAGPTAVVRRAEDPTAHLAANGLLASWGKDARELQLVVAQAGEHVDHHHRVEHRAGTLLATLQADVRADRPPPGDGDATRPLLDPADRSVQVHACHGRARQVEVLRDAILHELQQDPTLEPRDVIVMCPDIETFAPLIQATFAAGETTTGDDDADALPAELRPADLRVRLADRSLRQTNPVLGVVAQVMELVGARLTASQVLDLADREPVRRRFRLDDDDLARVQDWAAESGIRWGLDAAHRAPFKLDALPAGTWRAGLDRVLLGVAMTEDGARQFAGVLPLDDVDSGAIDLAGRLAELIDRVQAAVDALTTPKPIDRWATALADAADALTATSRADAWQRAELQRLLDDVVGEAAQDATALALGEVRSLLADRLMGRPTRANFRTGHLTVCTLVPMRSVPHRVVCLLGLDDGVFPRKAPRDGDDELLEDPHVGERDPRTEDRQLLLDALLAATDRLIVTYTGNDERTNAPRPPAVPVGELLEAIDATVRTDDDRPARERVLVGHPLQPFDPRNFATGALVAGRPWSFDRVTLDGARAMAGQRRPPAAFLTGPLTPVATRVVELEDLVRFAQHPTRGFLRQRLGFGVSERSDEIDDHLEVEMDGLAKWGVGQRMLDARLAGVDGRTAATAEIARGALPPGVLGKPVLDEVFPIVDAIATAALAATDADAGSADVRVALPGGRVVIGTVPGVTGEVLRTVTYSRVAAKHRIATWVRLLALTAADGGRACTALTIGRGSGDRIATVRIEPLDVAAAKADLAALVDVYDRGMREPLPLYCQTSAAYAQAARAGQDAVAAARRTWESEWNFDHEDKEPEHQLVLGGVRDFDELLADPPRSDEEGDGWPAAETTRLGRYARRVWDPLLAGETTTSA